MLGRKGANMMGMDQDDIVLAPWTTIKYRVSGSALTNTNQSATASSSSSGDQHERQYAQRFLSHGDRSIPQPHFNRDRQHASAGAIRQRGRDSGQSKIRLKTCRMAIDQITSLLRKRHHLRETAEDDFNTATWPKCRE